MPKKPGRASTRVTYPIEQLAVASFVFQHEEWLWRRKCAVTGCDHRMGPKTDEPGWVNWKSCDENQLPGHVVKADDFHEGVGMACPCHVGEILDATTPA